MESNLPTTVFKPEHLDLKQQLINRVVDLLNSDTELLQYGISKNYFDKPCEQIKLGVPGFKISIEVIAES